MKKLKFAKKKKVSISKLKEKAWKLFSEWIRRKDAIYGENFCITCGVWKSYKELQAGHWIPGRHPSVLFDERHCHPQCYHCNVGLKGNPLAYYHYMEKNYTKRVRDELERLDKVNKQFKPYELESIIDIYTRKLKELL